MVGIDIKCFAKGLKRIVKSIDQELIGSLKILQKWLRTNVDNSNDKTVSVFEIENDVHKLKNLRN